MLDELQPLVVDAIDEVVENRRQLSRSRRIEFKRDIRPPLLKPLNCLRHVVTIVMSKTEREREYVYDTVSTRWQMQSTRVYERERDRASAVELSESPRFEPALIIGRALYSDNDVLSRFLSLSLFLFRRCRATIIRSVFSQTAREGSALRALARRLSWRLSVDLVIKKPRSISVVRRINSGVYPVAGAPSSTSIAAEGGGGWGLVGARMERAPRTIMYKLRERDAWVPALRQLVITSELASGSVLGAR